MIYGIAIFDPTITSSPPSIRVASITPIIDRSEPQEPAELHATTSETRPQAIAISTDAAKESDIIRHWLAMTIGQGA